jgi:hypothetical protein
VGGGTERHKGLTADGDVDVGHLIWLNAYVCEGGERLRISIKAKKQLIVLRTSLR